MGRRLGLVLAACVVVLTACNPVKPPASGPTPGRSIAYYYIDDQSSDVFRSTVPFSRTVNAGMGTARQTLTNQGQVFLEVVNAGCPCGATSGFYTKFVPLGSINELIVRVVPGSNDAFISLLFDVDGDGDWAQWDANGMQTGLGMDDIGFGPPTQGGQIIIDDNRDFFVDSAAAFFTLGDLKAGAVAGIDANTPVGILVEAIPFFASDGDAASVVSQIVVNGVGALP